MVHYFMYCIHSVPFQALLELESNSDIRATLREIFFTGAKVNRGKWFLGI